MISPALHVDVHETATLLNALLDRVCSEQVFPCCCLRAMQSRQVNKFQVEGATFSFPCEALSLKLFAKDKPTQWHS